MYQIEYDKDLQSYLSSISKKKMIEKYIFKEKKKRMKTKMVKEFIISFYHHNLIDVLDSISANARMPSIFVPHSSTAIHRWKCLNFAQATFFVIIGSSAIPSKPLFQRAWLIAQSKSIWVTAVVNTTTSARSYSYFYKQWIFWNDK